MYNFEHTYRKVGGEFFLQFSLISSIESMAYICHKIINELCRIHIAEPVVPELVNRNEEIPW